MSNVQLDFKLEDDIWWVANALFPSWKGFQNRSGAYGAQSSAIPSDGHVKVVFAPEGRGNEPLNDIELSAIGWVIEHEAELTTVVLASILESYPSLQEQYGYSGNEKIKYMPDIQSVDDLRGLIGLHTINIHPILKHGVPYIGFELGCTWDDEHGLGVLMHGTRTVEIGGADTAILLWIAENDAV
ncbi:hypothetical protein [Methylophilus sp. Q8]|uniref:DUF6985 domain-containing protein n=1 Tax=Methylophilus sp. Q8 TaxID=1506586 RepID=UPI00068D875F|nr:hypothetical protein [Methylophilus sp. Q8]